MYEKGKFHLKSTIINLRSLYFIKQPDHELTKQQLFLLFSEDAILKILASLFIYPFFVFLVDTSIEIKLVDRVK